MTASQTQGRRGGRSRRDFIKLSGAAALALSSSSAAAPRAAGKNRPNVLVIITDQHHADALSCVGNKYIQTPALDSLAAVGVNFRLSYTNNPVCSPARSALLTGRTSCETGVYVNGRPIHKDIPNMGQWLSAKGGYEAVYAGKWHIPATYSTSIPGFRVLHTGIGGQGNVCDPAVAMACEAFIRGRKSDRPFLMVASFMQPHDICEWLRLNVDVPKRPRFPVPADWVPPLPANHAFPKVEPANLKSIRARNEPGKGKWTADHWRYYRWSYYRHVEQVDGLIGLVLQALRDTGADKNTLVVFTSDHGEGMGHHQMVRKSSPYDEASRVPLIVSIPGRAREGRVDTRHPVSGVDVMPTVCDYVGIAAPPEMRGRSLRKLLQRDVDESDGFTVTEISGDTGRMLRTRKYKYVTYRGDPGKQLFDMEADPGELKNLAADEAYADVVAKHRKLLLDWEDRLTVAPNVPEKPGLW